MPLSSQNTHAHTHIKQIKQSWKVVMRGIEIQLRENCRDITGQNTSGTDEQGKRKPQLDISGQRLLGPFPASFDYPGILLRSTVDEISSSNRKVLNLSGCPILNLHTYYSLNRFSVIGLMVFKQTSIHLSLAGKALGHWFELISPCDMEAFCVISLV